MHPPVCERIFTLYIITVFVPGLATFVERVRAHTSACAYDVPCPQLGQPLRVTNARRRHAASPRLGSHRRLIELCTLRVYVWSGMILQKQNFETTLSTLNVNTF